MQYRRSDFVSSMLVNYTVNVFGLGDLSMRIKGYRER